MAATLIIIGVFAGFFFLVVRPLQKKTGNYDYKDRTDRHHNPTYASMPGNVFHTINDKDK